METNQPVDTYARARAALQRPDYFVTPKWREQQSRADRRGAHPQILAFEKALIRRSRQIKIPLFAHCVVRTVSEQNKLRLDGYSRAGGRNAPHLYGLAVDIIHSVYGWNMPGTLDEIDQPERCWDLIGAYGKEVATSLGIKIEWGGDWSYYDPAHWQLKGFETIVDEYPFVGCAPAPKAD